MWPSQGQGAADGQQKYYHKWESIPRRLLSRQTCFLAFEASGIEPVATCFQDKCRIHCTSGATLHYGRVSNMNRKLDEGKSPVSLQAQHIRSRGNFHRILYRPALRLFDIKPNEEEMQLHKND